LAQYNKLFPTDLIVNITLQQDILVEKLSGRRTCEKCQKGYNICNIQRDGYNMDPLLPKVDGVCDKCSGKLIIRQDDKKEVILARFKEYEAKTFPLLAEYKKSKKVVDFEAKRGKKDYPQLKKIIEDNLKVWEEIYK